MEYVGGGELFAHLREEGMFNTMKSKYIEPNLDFTLHKLSSFLSIYIQRISFIGT